MYIQFAFQRREHQYLQMEIKNNESAEGFCHISFKFLGGRTQNNDSAAGKLSASWKSEEFLTNLCIKSASWFFQMQFSWTHLVIKLYLWLIQAPPLFHHQEGMQVLFCLI